MPISNKLVFLSNELLDQSRTQSLGVPLQFITFAHIEGKLYKHFRNEGTFVSTHGKVWGNRVVYGAIYAVQDFDFYIRTLDSYHQCSRSLLRGNHVNDVHHRLETKATPISFKTINELERLQYKEREAIRVFAYYGNLNHPRIKQRLNKTVSYRLIHGMDRHFSKLIREVIR